MSWLDSITGAKASEPTPSEPAPAESAPPEIHEVIVQLRPSSANDPGEIALAWFTFADGKVTLTSKEGTPIGEPIDCPPTLDPDAAARSAASRRWERNDRFDRPLGRALRGLA